MAKEGDCMIKTRHGNFEVVAIAQDEQGNVEVVLVEVVQHDP